MNKIIFKIILIQFIGCVFFIKGIQKLYLVIQNEKYNCFLESFDNPNCECLDDKIEVIVYNNQNDFKQSNIGLASEDNGNIGGVTRIIGDKIFIYFTGSHADLDKQIRTDCCCQKRNH